MTLEFPSLLSAPSNRTPSNLAYSAWGCGLFEMTVNGVYRKDAVKGAVVMGENRRYIVGMSSLQGDHQFELAVNGGGSNE